MLIASLILLSAPVPDPAEIVCVSRVRTGSRTDIERVCHSRAEWAALRRARNAERDPDRPNLFYPSARGG